MSSAPPKLRSSGSRLVVILLVAASVAIAATLFFLNPATHAIYPVCQFHRLTGLNCPGCGMTRALYALLHGQWQAALRDNALLVGGLGALGLRGTWMAVNRLMGRKNGAFVPIKLLWPLLVVALVFSVLRNLPAFAYLSP